MRYARIKARSSAFIRKVKRRNKYVESLNKTRKTRVQVPTRPPNPRRALIVRGADFSPGEIRDLRGGKSAYCARRGIIWICEDNGYFCHFRPIQARFGIFLHTIIYMSCKKLEK